MKQGLLLQWSPLLPSPSLQWSLLPSSPLCVSVRRTRHYSLIPTASAALETSSSSGGQLTARERRQLRNEKRESRVGSNNWREEVEERLLHKPKKRYASWTEELNLDNLALLGPQWWVVRVARVTAQETAERLARSFVRNFPSIEFKVYYPAVREKKILKNGSLTIKSKPLFPGCVFLHCLLNKEIHDFVRECDGIGGFLGSKVGNTKRQINRPKPVAVDEMEAIFRQAKEEQEISDQAFEEKHRVDGNVTNREQNSNLDSASNANSIGDAKPKRRSKKGSDLSKSSLVPGEDYRSLAPGSNVCVLSGPFTEFTGRLKELDHKTGKAKVGFMLFGKESFVDLEVNQIVAEKT